MPRILLSLAAALILSTSCGAAIRGPEREFPARARLFLESAPSVYAPENVGAISLSETDQLRARFENALDVAVRPMLRHDPALDLVAAVAAETYSEVQRVPADTILQWSFWKSGSTAIFSDIRTGWAKHGRDRGRATLLDYEAVRWARLAVPPSPRAYGVARFSEGAVTSQAIVFGEAPLEVDTFVKTYAPGAPLTLRFRPLDASSDFRFFADDDGGKIVEQSLRPGSDGWVVVARAAPTRPGRYFLEVTARYPQTTANLTVPRTVLWVPIYVDTPEPAEPDGFMRSPPSAAGDEAAWPARIADIYDAVRAKAGRRPVTRDPKLSAIATKRSALIARRGLDRSFDQRVPKLASADTSARQFASFLGPMDSPDERARMTLLVPSARTKLVSADQLSLGIAIATEASNGGNPPRFTAVEYMWAKGSAAAPPADDSPPEAPATPRDVTRSPRAEDFLVIPVRAFVLRAPRVASLHCAPGLDARVRPMFEKVNRIWSAAGIHFRVDDVRVIDAEAGEVEEAVAALPPSTRGRPPHRLVTPAIPASTRGGEGFRVYYLHDFDVNGVYLGRGELMVRETAVSTKVEGGIDESLPRVTSHELGHGLGLAHRQDRSNVMASGTAGTRLNEVEVARVRSTARAMRGVKTFEAVKGTGDSRVAAAIAALADREIAPWVAAP